MANILGLEWKKGESEDLPFVLWTLFTQTLLTASWETQALWSFNSELANPVLGLERIIHGL